MAFTLTVLGDSIAVGVGASRPQDAIGPRAVSTLADAGVEAELHVLAVPGARSDALGAQAISAATVRPDLAIIVIGANDLTHFTPPQIAAAQLGEAVRVLRAAGAAVIVVPAPDMSLVPWVPPTMRPMVRATSDAFRHAQSVAARAAGAVIVEIPADAVQRTAGVDLFSPDRFHPSSAGYALLAAALGPAVLAASG